MQNVTLTPAQCRAARALVGIQQMQLAAAAHVARKTLADFEGGKTTPNHRTMAAIRATLEAAGVVFEAAGEMVDGGPGVRLAEVQPHIGRRLSDEPDARELLSPAQKLTPARRLPKTGE